VSNDEIRGILPTMDIYAYPSIWMECCSLALIEALAAGCHVVTPNYASLPETTLGYAHMYDFAENIDVHANRFGNTLSVLISKLSSPDHRKDLARRQAIQSSFVNDYYSVNRVLRKWHDLFRELHATSRA
jgi:glycosyltransferase involved in cell wall biosynthesis